MVHSMQPVSGGGGRLAGRLLCFFILCLALGLQAGGAQNGAAGKRILGELTCSGAVTYRVGTGPWVTQPQGTFPVVLPVAVKDVKSFCRILVPGQGLVEAAAGSQFSLDASSSKAPLMLSLEKGSVLYSLPKGAELKVVQPATGAQAQGKAVKKNQMGVARVDTGGKKAEFYCLNGEMAVTGKNGQHKSLAAGKLASLADGVVSFIDEIHLHDSPDGITKADSAGAVSSPLQTTVADWQVSGSTTPGVMVGREFTKPPPPYTCGVCKCPPPPWNEWGLYKGHMLDWHGIDLKD